MGLAGLSMKWETYSKEFEKIALRGNFSSEEITFFLGYAKNLYDKKLPIIYDQEHLALLVGYKYEFLLKISNAPRKFYRTFTIPKKSGGERKISEPLPSLKEIQHWILQEILDKVPVSRFAKAYVKKRSIRENARFHIGQKFVLTLDIEDFFGSLKFEKVYAFFLHLGYSVPVSTMLSNLCCLGGGLPQGAPTSPSLSNLLMLSADKRISGFIKNKGIRYTRYADDMTFSGDFEPGMVIKFVHGVLSHENLKLNEKKTHVRKPGQRQEVTGAVVNEKIQAPKELRKGLRQAVYYIEKYGLASHLDKTQNLKANHIYHWLGIANFILFLNPEDQETVKDKEILRKYISKD
jgi:RNA-directed DNA polymerase